MRTKSGTVSRSRGQKPGRLEGEGRRRGGGGGGGLVAALVAEWEARGQQGIGNEANKEANKLRFLTPHSFRNN